MDNLQENWFKEFKKTQNYELLKDKPIAYFSAEYALSHNLPTYAGGLGILAGDIVLECAENKFPILFVGLYYKQGQNSITRSSEVLDREVSLLEVKGTPLVISIPISNRKISFQIWIWEKNGTKVYLLDTDVSQNFPEDRVITERLYVEDRELRLKQEILLGIGGYRFLRELLGYHPAVYHLNEGHSAFLALELAHHEMIHQKVDFRTACKYASSHILFTNHTLVPAGQEIFASDSVSRALSEYAREIGVDIEQIVSIGINTDPKLFSMTTFSFRLSSKRNAVSRLHQERATKIWPEYHMEAVTNGVNVFRWDKIGNTESVLEMHKKNKSKMLEYVRQKIGKSWSEDTLVLGWGRRLVAYKQPLVMLENIEKLLEVIQKSDLPIKFIFSGPTNDEMGSQVEEKLKNVINTKLKDVAIFIPYYNIKIAEIITSGCDVWLNTPEIGQEACGTSGMKAALNGVLPLSTNDGWIAETELHKYGWVINDSKDLNKKLLETIENEIVPLYKEHTSDPLNSRWRQYMDNCRQLILAKYSTARVLREYIEKFYIPIFESKHPRSYK